MMFCKHIYLKVTSANCLCLALGRKSEANMDQGKGNNEQIIFNQLLEQHLNEEQA